LVKTKDIKNPYSRVLLGHITGVTSHFNTLQEPVHPSAAPQDVLGYFRVLKSPYIRIGT